MGIVAMGLRGHLAGAMALALGLAGPAWAQAGNGVGTQFELAFWQSVTGSDDPTLYEAYLQQYPSGTFSALAKAKVMRLRNGAAPAAVEAVRPAQIKDLPVAPPAAVQPVVSPPPVAPQLVTAKPVVAQPVAAPAALVSAVLIRAEPAPVAAPPRVLSAASQASADIALLAELAQSQEVGGATMRVAAAEGFLLPTRPVLNTVPDLPLPTAFCSAEQRNEFHETRYKPVLESARANNAAAVAHMQRLQQVYDSLQLARDPNPMNAIANEASEYQMQVANRTYERQLAMVQQFDAIMAVPLGGCQVVAAK